MKPIHSRSKGLQERWAFTPLRPHTLFNPARDRRQLIWPHAEINANVVDTEIWAPIEASQPRT